MSKTRAYVALGYVSLAWGTTYLAIRIGVAHYPAFLFAGIRQVVSGLILATAALILNREKDLSLRNVLRQMLVGFLMLTLGNGCVTWGERTVPSGIAALLCSMMPIFAVLFNVFFSGKDRLNLTILGGMLLGVAGVGLIFKDSLGAVATTGYMAGMLAIVTATASWAMGSVVNKQHKQPVNPFFNSGLQLLFGGIFMLLLSPVIDDFTGFQVWHPDSLLALGYLILFGSVLAYAAYMYALANLPVGIATVYAYINPLIAVSLGFFMGEPITLYTWLAFGIIMLAVFVVNRGYRPKPALKTS